MREHARALAPLAARILAIVAVSSCGGRVEDALDPCRIPDAPADWVRTRLAIADASISLPREDLGRRIGPDSNSFEGWYGARAQILASAVRHASVQAPARAIVRRCSLRLAGRPATMAFVARRARPPSQDSVYGARAVVMLPRGVLLTLEVGAEGRASFEFLLPVIASLQPLGP